MLVCAFSLGATVGYFICKYFLTEFCYCNILYIYLQYTKIDKLTKNLFCSVEGNPEHNSK